jgi:hypothetical protein
MVQHVVDDSDSLMSDGSDATCTVYILPNDDDVDAWVEETAGMQQIPPTGTLNQFTPNDFQK